MNYLASREELKKLIPHKEPMILIDYLKECDVQTMNGCCVTEIGQYYNVALNNDNSLPTFALIEIMAQTTAACISYCNELRGLPNPKIGLLLSIKDFKVYRSEPIPKGTLIESWSKTEYQDNSFLQCSTKIYENNNFISEASLIVYTPQI